MSVAPETSPPITQARPERINLTARQRRAVVAASVGNAVEYLDWVIYGTLVATFSPHFFPSSDPIQDLLAALAVFAVGFVARPVGAYFLGMYADRRGRKAALLLAIVITSLSSLIIGLAPGYDSIGVLAPIILVTARLAAGFSTGGEGSASLTFLAEVAPKGRRGFIGSFQQVSTGVGLLAGSLLSTLLFAVFSAEYMASWGWRYAFFIVAAFGLVGMYLRTQVDESEVFKEAKTAEISLKRVSFAEVFRTRPKSMLIVFCLTIPATIINYMWLTYMPTFAHTVTGLPLQTTLLVNSIALAISCAILPFAGILSDRWGRRPSLLIFTVGFAVFAWPAVHFLTDSVLALFAVQTIGVILLAFDGAIIAATFNELFPTRVRATALAIPYAVAIAAFGGTAPYITTWMFANGLVDWVWVYIAFGGVVGAIAALLMPETYKRDLTNA